MNKLVDKVKRKSKEFHRKVRQYSSSRSSAAAVRKKRTRSRSVANTKKLLFITRMASLALVILVLGIIGVFSIFAYFSRELPDPNRLLERNFELSTRFYDKNGEILFENYGDKNRTLVQVENISPHILHATLAVEDSQFYRHKGYSVRGMLRAVKNTFTGEGLQGGSTLTQQVIKNTLLSQERTVDRKIKEFILSLQLENRYSKHEIFQMYLNETPYGGQNYGIYSASHAYFNKDPKDLTIAEAAYLAGLPQRPSYYSQFGSTPEAGLERKNYVLYLMNVRGWSGPDGNYYHLNDEEYEKAKEMELNFHPSKVPLVAPHFVFYTKQILSDILGEDAVDLGGLQVTTSLDLEIQRMAQEIVYQQVESSKSLNVWNGAMVILEPTTGHILAMVGSKGYNIDPEPEGCVSGAAGEGGCKFDPYVNVTTALRQPGSAIKPITYATMLSQGYTPAQPLIDVPTKFEGSAPDKPYVPVNYDGIFRGVMSVRRSLGNSLNIPAVKALKIVGIDNMIDQAEKMGITSFKDRSRYGLALTLGGGEVKLLELTGAFSVFANKGVYIEPVPIIEVKDSSGKVIYKPPQSSKKALGEDVAFLISDILSDDGARSSAFGAGSLLNIPGHTVAVKTGTTDDKRDNYAIGFTPSIVAGVWVGNNNNERMNPYVASGITGATPIWNDFMRNYLADKENEPFEPPNNIKKIEIDELTGMFPQNDTSKRYEWFIQGTEPTAKSDWYQRIEICKIDGRIANSGCRDANETKEETYIRIKAEIPEWQYYVDAWVKEAYSGDTKYFPPQMRSKLEFEDGKVKNKDEVHVQIVDFKDGDEIPLEFRLNVEVSCYRDVDKVKIYMDGEKITDDSSDPYGYNFKLDKSQIGEHEFKVIGVDEKGNEASYSIRLIVKGY